MEFELPPSVPEEGHKGLAGRVLVVAGSTQMPGAAILAARAALRAGAGLVQVAHLWPGTLPIVAGAVPEATHLDLSQAKDLQAGRLPAALIAARRDVTLVGPGLSRTGRTRELVRRLLEQDGAGAFVLDADALAVCAGALEVLRGATATPLVITPHPGEAGLLLDAPVPQDEEGRRRAALELASESGATVVLKGRGTWVAREDTAELCSPGNPGLATGGTGDVLSGILAAYLARAHALGRDIDPLALAVSAVEVHARAGDLAAEQVGQRALIASDVVEALGAVQRGIDGA